MILTAFDTETTGLIEYKRPMTHASQPHLVQLALVMVDTTARRLLKKASIIIATNHPIGEKAFEAHGISQEVSLGFGVQCRTALALFRHFASRSDRMVAHNKDFDLKLLEIQAIREKTGWEFMDGKDVVCTMAAARKEVNCPPTEKMIAAGFRGPKAPQLGECYQHFYGEKLEGAHDALIDTEACLRVYYTLVDKGLIKEGETDNG